MRIAEVLRPPPASGGTASIRAIRDSFDEFIVSEHLRDHHRLKMPVSSVFEALHKLSEQTYENNALTFGCLLDSGSSSSSPSLTFPGELLTSKKYRALSDGFRTAYHVSSTGHVVNFVDLEKFGRKELSEKHYYPDWAEPVARSSRDGICGICLNRQGDMLVFDRGSVRFTYRYGRWQYWNHAHLLNLLKDRARAQRVPPNILGNVVSTIYRAALDIAFRRCGGLFVVLHNRKNLRQVVRVGDAVDDTRRTSSDQQFDPVVRGHTIQSLPRAVVVELASLDGAVVLENSGRIRAYGAVLQPKKAGRIRGAEAAERKQPSELQTTG